MTRTAHRLGRFALAGSVALLTATSAFAATRPDQPVQGWSAMEGVAVTALLEQAQDMPTSDMAIGDQPYCASDGEIGQTLTHDFNEQRIEADASTGTELWGSEQMGTWTLVATRDDQTSCIIASGIGYQNDRDAEVYYEVSGLN